MIRKEDIVDLDVVDREELLSSGNTSYKSGVTVVSTTSGTKRVVISGFDLTIQRDAAVEAGDKVTLAGTSGGVANGTFTVNSIIDANTFDVVESIATSTGGTADFKHGPGAKKVGVDVSGFSYAATNNLQDFGKESHIARLLEEAPAEATHDYVVTRTNGRITKEEWKRGDTTLIRSIDYTRVGDVLSQEDVKVFGLNGTTLLGHLRVVYTRTGGVVSSSTRTRIV